MKPIRKKRVLLCLTLGVLSVAGTGPSGAAENSIAPRPSAWATPTNRPGLSNLFKVSTVLYRGAQPEAEGFKQLEAMGVKTVINLRDFHDDSKLLAGTSLRYVHIPINTLTLDTNEVVRFMNAVTDTNNWPVFVHCKLGADRTGTMVAIYRILVEGWSKQDAIREMRDGGFGHNTLYKNLIGLIEKTDTAALWAKKTEKTPQQ